MILGPVFGVDGRRGTSAKALKASKGAGARISSDYLATPPVPKFAPSGLQSSVAIQLSYRVDSIQVISTLAS